MSSEPLTGRVLFFWATLSQNFPPVAMKISEEAWLFKTPGIRGYKAAWLAKPLFAHRLISRTKNSLAAGWFSTSKRFAASPINVVKACCSSGGTS